MKVLLCIMVSFYYYYYLKTPLGSQGAPSPFPLPVFIIQRVIMVVYSMVVTVALSVCGCICFVSPSLIPSYSAI